MIINNVKKYREALPGPWNWNIDRLAECLGMTVSYYYMIEAGTRTPSLKRALLIARIFGCRVEDLWRLDRAPEPIKDSTWPRVNK